MEKTYYKSSSTANVWIHKSTLHDLKQYVNVDKKSSYFASNFGKTTDDIKKFLLDYMFHVNFTKKSYKDKKNRFGFVLEMKLPNNLNTGEQITNIKKFIKQVVDDISLGQNPHYFVIYKRINKQKFIDIVILDRKLYPDGKWVNLIHKKDTWVDEKGIMRSVKDPGYKNKLKLLYKKGDSYEALIYISRSKLEFPHITTKPKSETTSELFKELMNNLKILYIKYFGNISIKFYETKLIIQKITYKKLVKINNEFRYMNVDEYERKTLQHVRKRKISAINLIIAKINHLIATKQELHNKSTLRKIKAFSTNIIDEIAKDKTNIIKIEEIVSEILTTIEKKPHFYNQKFSKKI